MIEMEGILEYDPDRGDMKSQKEYWLVLQLPLSLVRYYQYFLKTDLHLDIKDPAWGAHVSIVRGETPPNAENWKKYDGQKLKIKFNPYIKQVKDKKSPGSFYVIMFESEEITAIREELGLKSKYFEYHITVGRTYYD